MSDLETRTARFGAALSTVHEELDWDLLGELYCHAGGEHFFPEQQREALMDAGLQIAEELADAIGSLPAGGPGRSLYLGAAVAELAPILLEALIAEREIQWRNLPCPEVTELNRALQVASERLELALPRVETATGPFEAQHFDHLWCVSVWTDPDRFPALHDELYERREDELAAGGGDLSAERERALGLAGELLDAAHTPALLCTTDEELPLFQSLLPPRGLVLNVPERGRLTPIVGDVLRICRLDAVPSGERSTDS